MKLVLRLLLLTLAAFLSSLFASPEAEGVGWKTAPDDEVRQHGDGQHEYAGPEAEWKGEKRRVPDGKRAEQFFSETLEDAGENGPSAREPREQCRINGWLNYDTASGCTVATKKVKGPPKPSPKFEPPTNPPQNPPKDIPDGWRVREMPSTQQYPDGYWKLEKPMKDGSWQPIDPSTMKPGGRPETHVPFPPTQGG